MSDMWKLFWKWTAFVVVAVAVIAVGAVIYWKLAHKVTADKRPAPVEPEVAEEIGMDPADVAVRDEELPSAQITEVPEDLAVAAHDADVPIFIRQSFYATGDFHEPLKFRDVNVISEDAAEYAGIEDTSAVYEAVAKALADALGVDVQYVENNLLNVFSGSVDIESNNLTYWDTQTETLYAVYVYYTDLDDITLNVDTSTKPMTHTKDFDWLDYKRWEYYFGLMPRDPSGTMPDGDEQYYNGWRALEWLVPIDGTDDPNACPEIRSACVDFLGEEVETLLYDHVVQVDDYTIELAVFSPDLDVTMFVRYNVLSSDVTVERWYLDAEQSS